MTIFELWVIVNNSELHSKTEHESEKCQFHRKFMAVTINL